MTFPSIQSHIDEARKWTPIMRGKIYCSPRCGRGCTRAEYERAVKAADILAARMGDGWEPVVWENLGWFYSVQKGVAALHVNIFRNTIVGYTVYFNSAKQIIADAKTPEDALGFAIQDARTVERRISDDLAALA